MKNLPQSTVIKPIQRKNMGEETFNGEVVEIHENCGKIEFIGINGEPVEYTFKKEFLYEAGVRHCGDLVKLKLSSSQKTDRGVKMEMEMWKSDELEEKIISGKKIIGNVLGLEEGKRKLS